MIKYYISFTFLVCVHHSFAQVGEQKISISFDSVPMVEALQKIEEVTPHRLYFLNDWFDGEYVSGSYEDTTFSDLLTDFLEGRNINYYFLKDYGIVLTRNSIIHDELPGDFFGKPKRDSINEALTGETEETLPFLYREDNAQRERTIETFRIGRETRNRSARSFVLSGIVKNKRTGEPIPDLYIIAKNTNVRTITDERGFYELKLKPGSNILEMVSLEVQNSEKRVIIYGNGKLDFNLEESLEMLEEVVVEAEVDSNVKQALSGSERINAEETKTIPLVLGERDVLRVATSLPGISTTGEGTAGFNVRGGGADQNLILFDDAVIYNPQHFFGIFSALNPFAIDKFNIYKGVVPAEYGGRLSSVFDIGSKNGNNEKFSGEASVGPVTGNLVLEVPVVKEKSSLLMGARGAYANWILRSLDEESLNNSRATFYDFLANYDHKINERNSIKATAYYSYDDFSISSDSLYIYDNRLLSIKWNRKFNEKNRGSLLLTNSQYQFDIEFDGDSNDDFLFGYRVNETEAKLKLDYSHSPRLNFTYGLASKLYAIDPGSIEPLNDASDGEELTIPRERALESGAFLSADWEVSDRFSVDAGIRYSFYTALGPGTHRIYEPDAPRSDETVVNTLNFDRNETIETYTNPEFRISTRYLISPTFSTKAGYGRTVQYLHRLSNNTLVSPIDIWKLSDINIEPQRADQVTLGFFKNIAENKYELSLEGFYKRSQEIIDFKTGAQILLNQNIETEVLQGDGESYGVEFLIRKNKGRLNGWLGYTYSRSFIRFDSPFREERINDGDFFPSNFDKPHDLSIVTNYKLTRRLSLSGNFVYQTGRPVTVPVGNFNFNNSDFVVFSDRNSFRIPDFYRLDLGLNIEGNHKIKKLAHSFWTISVYNVLGRNNPFSVFFVTENGQIRAVQSSIFAIPIPAITYNLKF
ncbi:carboxypeptidase-like regulatory domain-containing protein [Flavobacteriaceae bacterium GF1]